MASSFSASKSHREILFSISLMMICLLRPLTKVLLPQGLVCAKPLTRLWSDRRNDLG